MNSLLKTVHSLTNKRNLLVRESLQKQLNTCVLEMQSAPGVAEGGTVGNCEEATTLCSILEAVFLHGLKDSLLNRVTEALSGPDFDAMPQPSFWGPLLVFSHRQIIDQIQALTQVTTEVGYCRAWIRLALNEGLLASYLCSIKRDNSALKPYYNRSAFIRDMDLMEIAQRLIESLDYVHFELSCNSSLLNFWSSTPLLIAGIWSPPLKSCPVFSAVDIAKTITTELTDNDNFDEVETASSIGSLGSFNSSQSALNNIACITEDEALKIILANKKSNNIDNQVSDNSMEIIAKKGIVKENAEHTEEVPKQTINNSTPKKDAETNTTGTNTIETSTTETNTTTAPKDSVPENLSKENDVSNDTAAANVGNSLIGRLG